MSLDGNRVTISVDSNPITVSRLQAHSALKEPLWSFVTVTSPARLSVTATTTPLWRPQSSPRCYDALMRLRLTETNRGLMPLVRWQLRSLVGAQRIYCATLPELVLCTVSAPPTLKSDTGIRHAAHAAPHRDPFLALDTSSPICRVRVTRLPQSPDPRAQSCHQLLSERVQR